MSYPDNTSEINIYLRIPIGIMLVVEEAKGMIP